MTHLISTSSTKKDRAIRFGAELNRAMKARDVGRRTVAEAVGSSGTSVMYWRTGRLLPRIETAQRLATALTWPRLASLAIELRKKRCLVDDVEFVDDSGSDNRVYCSASCQRVKHKSVVGVDRRQRAARAERALLVHRRAVAAYCTACEPGGRCVTPECELRPVSPLPLFEERDDVVLAVHSKGNGYRDPAARAARIAKAAEASKRARGLVPA